MKLKSLLLLTALSAGIEASAQLNVWVTDSVEMGAGYANDVFYNLKNGNRKVQAGNDWDLAFQMSAFGDPGFNAAVRANHAKKKVAVFSIHKDAAAFSSVSAADTVGLQSSSQLINNDHSFGLGAFYQNRNFSDTFDFGWGKYQGSPNHNLLGDSVYIVKVNNAAYKVLIQEYKSIPATDVGYTFRVAALDGSSDNTVTIKRSGTTDFTKRAFAYYNIATNTVLDREPNRADWDLLFTQYIKKGITMGGPNAAHVVYTGVLTNLKTKVAVVRDTLIDPDTAKYTSFTSSFITSQNAIGDDWKTHIGMGVYRVPTDSTTYFIQTQDGAYHQIVFTRFDGTATGKIVFKKRMLTFPTAIKNMTANVAALAIVPNPSANGKVNVMVDVKDAQKGAQLIVTDITGKTVTSSKVDLAKGVNAFGVNTASFAPGSYFITITNGSWKISDKLIVQ